MMHDFEVNYLAYPLTYISNKLTTENKEVISWCEENTSPLVKIDDRASFDRAKWGQNSIYNYEESYGTINCQSTMKWFSWFSMGPTLHRMESTSVLLET